MATVLDMHCAVSHVRTYTIEPELAGDEFAREALLDAAMGPNRRKKSSEALRRGRLPAEGLALVARGDAGEVLGTVRLWNVHAGLGADGKPLPALLLGPLAVDPACEGLGIGGALVRAAIAEAKARGHGAILLVGDAPYYERFGFFSEKTGTLTMPGPFEKKRFLALELFEDWLNGASGVLVPSGRKLQKPVLRKAA